MVSNYQAGDEPVPGSGYRLTGFLGRGGFGEVWKATAPGGTEVAIKILDLSGQGGQKEFRALQLVKRVRNPNLVPVFAFWLKLANGSVLDLPDDELQNAPTRRVPETGPLDETGTVHIDRGQMAARQLVIAMGLADKSLFDRLEECWGQQLEGIPQAELLRYMEDAARAIDYLNSPIHETGARKVSIQHCDIKPRNIMIVGQGAQVCDFGLAQVLGTDHTTSVGMTIPYAAPECLRTGKPSAATDQYSLAVTYYQLRTGTLPFDSETHVGVINAKLDGKHDFSGVSPAEAAVLRRAMSPAPADRFPSAAEMVAALRRAEEGQKEPEPPPRAAGRLLLFVAAIAAAAAFASFYFFRQPPESSLEQARRHRDAGQYEMAIEAYAKVLAGEPLNATALQERAACCEELGRFDEAVEGLTQAIRSLPADSDVLADLYAARARCLDRLDMPGEAAYDRKIAELLEKIEKDPGNHAELNTLAFYLIASPVPNTADAPKALRFAERACELTDWQNALYLDTLAAAHSETGDYEQAVRWMDEAIRLATDEDSRREYEQAKRWYGQKRPYHELMLEPTGDGPIEQ